MNISDVLAGTQCNKNFEVVRLSKLYNSDKVYVTLRFVAPNFDIDKEVTVPLKDIGKSGNYIPEGFAIEGVPFNKRHIVIGREVNKKLTTESPETLFPQGFHQVDGRWIYVLGSMVINKGDNTLYPYNPDNIRFPKNIKKITHSMYYNWCRLFCSQGEAQAALFLSALTPYIFPVVHSLNIPTKTASPFLVGFSGSGKTSYCELLCNTFGAHSTANLAMGKAAILDLLGAQHGGPVLLDDLCDTSSDRERMRKLTTLSEIVQQLSSSGTPLKFDNISLCITGEYLPQSFSTINRVVVLYFEKEFNSKVLTELQDCKACYEVFLIYFISWICANAKDLRSEVESLLLKGAFDFTASHADSTEYIGFPRVMASHKILSITEFLVLRFFSNGYFSEGPGNLNVLLRRGVRKSISDTLEAIRNRAGIPPSAEALVRAYIENPKIVAKSLKKYKKKENKHLLAYDGYFYFRGKDLANFLSAEMSVVIGIKKLSAELSAANLLVSFGGELSGKLPLSIRGTDNRRFYRISIARFEEFAQILEPSFLKYTREFYDED